MSAAVLERGIDTLRLVRYLDRDSDLDRARALMPEGRLVDRVEGHRVGLMPGLRLLWLEGRADRSGLTDPADLAAVQGRLLDGLEVLGLPRGRDGGVGRLDGTVGVVLGSAPEASATLAGLAALDVPRMKPVVHGKPAQTVYLEGAATSKKFGRIYRKDIESPDSPPWHLRFEDQRRYTRETRRAVENLEPGQAFQRRFEAMARSAHGVKAVSVPVLQRELAERVNSGDVTRQQAERLAGFLLLEQSGARSASRWTANRRRREVRDHGLVLADDFFEPVEVDLGPTLEAALAAWDA